MNAVAVFFGTLGILVPIALVTEVVWSWRRGLGWYDPRDTFSNLSLAAGNLALGGVVVGGVLAATDQIAAVAPLDLHAWLPWWALLPLGFVLTELCQYVSHRISHVWNPLVAGHVTHHSSPHMNLSTAVRINWFYRLSVAPFYLPLPLLGFGALEFVAFQTVMQGYNLFLHTRVQVPYGPLAYVLVSPAAHRLHHSADPAHAGNYGGALIVFDRLFGTYRHVEDDTALSYGIDENVGAADVVTLNLHWLVDLWNDARTRGAGVVGAVLGTRAPTVGRTPAAGTTPSAWAWLALAALLVGGMALQRLAPTLPIGVVALGTVVLLGGTTVVSLVTTGPGSPGTDSAR